MLEEDLDKERFFALARRTYWEAPEGSTDRASDADAHRQAGLSEMDYRQIRRRHRRRQRNRPAHQVARARARSRPGCFRRSDRSAACFSSTATAYREPVLVSSADGVGTKLKVAFMTGRHDTVGADLVNHCVNDILVQGARPLFFLDYLATGRLSPDVAEQVVAGVARGCRENGCALIGGETAEMPGFYADGEYDIAGFIVGVVEREPADRRAADCAGRRADRSAVRGLHTNGYSLARRVLFERAAA